MSTTDSAASPSPFEGLGQPGDKPTADETSQTSQGASSASTDPGTSAPSPDAAPNTEGGSTAGLAPGDTPNSVVTDLSSAGPSVGTTPAAPMATSGEATVSEPTDSPVTVQSDRESVESEVSGASVTRDEVPEGVTIVGYNPTDGMPILQDPTYRGTSDPTFENVALARNLMADETATEAERSSGERTITARPPEESDILDGSYVGMAPAVEYRPAQGIRVLRMDRPFRAGGSEGKAGDYLGEFNGQRMVITQTELDEHFVIV